jgi:hypothetical protein
MHYLAGGNWNEKLSVNEYREMYKFHPLIVESVKLGHQIPTSVGPGTAFAAVHYIGCYYQGQPQLADEYMHIMAKGTLPDGSFPAQGNSASATRERAIRGRRGVAVFTPKTWVSLAAHGWNLYRTGQLRQQIKPPEVVVLAGWDMEKCMPASSKQLDVMEDSGEDPVQNKKITRIR